MGKFIDLTGQRFGRLIVIEKAENSKTKYGTVIKWLCKCDCGNTRIVPTGELKKGRCKHCGCLKVKDLTGKRFNRLIVIQRVKNNKHNSAMWECQCDCGGKTITSSAHLNSGHTKSCGCLSKELVVKLNKKHNMCKTRLYIIWHNMKARCNNNNNNGYKDYGGRDIKVCEEWNNDFMNFYNWTIQNGYRDDLTIDRIDVNGNYEPNNCRWATTKEQANNKRNNFCITYHGETRTLKQWCEYFNINYGTVKSRIKRKLPQELWFFEGTITYNIKQKYINNGEKI